MRRNISDLENLVKLAAHLEIKEIALIPLVIFHKGLAIEEESLDNNLFLVRKYIDRILTTARYVGVKVEEGISVKVHPREMRLQSKSIPKCVYSCYIDCFGFLYPCCNVTYSFGNFKELSLSQMLTSNRFLFFKENVLEKRLTCETCVKFLNKMK